MDFEKQYNNIVNKFIISKKNALVNKIDVLKILNKEQYFSQIEVARQLNCTAPLIAFHLNGSHRTDIGLISLGMAEKFILEGSFMVRYRITDFGKHILKQFSNKQS